MGRWAGPRMRAGDAVSEPEGRGVAWTEERGTSDEGRRCLKSAPEASGKIEYFRLMSSRQAPRDLRASDVDRDRVLALLTEAMSDGRLTPDDHSERVQRAFSARTLGELPEPTPDLAAPAAHPAPLDGGPVIPGRF